jgi:nicotinamidase-related amidase
MRFDPNHSIGLVIDIQERLFPHIHQHDEMARRASILIQGLRILNVPLLVTQQYTKGLGPTIAPIAEALGAYEPIEKMTFSAVACSDCEAQLLASGRHNVIICGIEAHVCVLQTVLDLRQTGQSVFVVEDAISSRSANDKAVAMQRMREAGAVVTTTESVLFQLLHSAEAPSFKAISALVK